MKKLAGFLHLRDRHNKEPSDTEKVTMYTHGKRSHICIHSYLFKSISLCAYTFLRLGNDFTSLYITPIVRTCTCDVML